MEETIKYAGDNMLTKVNPGETVRFRGAFTLAIEGPMVLTIDPIEEGVIEICILRHGDE